MANDIILTDEEQAERFKAWWKENGVSVVTGALIGIAAIAGYNYWQAQQNDGLEQASAQYNLLLGAMNAPDSAAARELSKTILDDHGGTIYATKAALIQAKLLTDSGELVNALKSLSLAKSSASEPGLAHVANLRIIRVYLEQGEFELAKTAIDAESERVGFDSQYLELEGDIAYGQGDLDLAREKYTSAGESVSADPGYAGILQLKADALGAGTASIVADVQFENTQNINSQVDDTIAQAADPVVDDGATNVDSIQN